MHLSVYSEKDGEEQIPAAAALTYSRNKNRFLFLKQADFPSFCRHEETRRRGAEDGAAVSEHSAEKKIRT